MISSKIQTGMYSRFKIADSVINPDSGVKIPVIVGQVGRVDETSPNGYRYKNGFWDTVLSNQVVKDAIANRDVLGMIEHPSDDNDYIKTPYEKASHIVLKAWVDSGNPYAQIGLLNNEHGNKLKSLIDVGHRPGVSTRGLGNIEQDNIGKYIPVKDYLFITWDIVKSPNFGDLKMDKVTDSLVANPIFKELCEMHQLEDSIDEHYVQAKLASDKEKAIEALKTLQEFLMRSDF